jgi:hypothetical protein
LVFGISVAIATMVEFIIIALYIDKSNNFGSVEIKDNKYNFTLGVSYASNLS